MRYLLALALTTVAVAQQAPRRTRPVSHTGTVELVALDATDQTRHPHATADNLAGRAVSEARVSSAFGGRSARPGASGREGPGLRSAGLRRLSPWRVTKLFWDVTPPDKREFVADPSKGSKHNRGCAVDLSMYNLATGREVEMPSAYDEMTPRAYPDYAGGPEEPRRRRDLLRSAMEREGFTVEPNEWWHFNYKDWQQYPILDVEFGQIRR
jgi:D-alanyl-D-alanine dipeptidase